MTRQTKHIFQAYLTLLTCGSLVASPGHRQFAAGRANLALHRPIAVADIIQLTKVLSPEGSQIASFSPDGTQFAILLSKGNLEKNTNDYSLELFRTHDVAQLTKPRTLASFSSSSNRPAIQQVRWIDDHAIAFLGEQPGQMQQLYIDNLDSGEITRMTDHHTNLTAYAVQSSGDAFFIAEDPAVPLLNDKTRRDGIIVTKQFLPDLIALEDRVEAEEHQSLFVKRRNQADAILVQGAGINAFSAYSPAPALSPDGHYLIVKSMVVGTPPAEWSEYQDRWIQKEVLQGSASVALYRFELVDTASLEARFLLNAPTGYAHSDVLWAPDSRSVVIAGTYLPLDGTRGSERQARQRKRFAAEISIPAGEVSPITDEDVQLDLWNANTGTLRGHLGGPTGPVVHYQKIGAPWRKVDIEDHHAKPDHPVQVSLDEDPNTPPRLYVRDEGSGQKSLLFDPNPELAAFQLGKVESINFKSSNGAQTDGVLYFPVDYVPGKKYPLIVQTHGDDLSKFMLDGPYTTAFAAQPLAGRGFFVAQLKEDFSRIRTDHEVTDESAAYEGVIDYLDARGLVDAGRVGIIAFSRTGLAVEYALTHSRHRFAAASLADISDAGYFRYVALLNLWQAAWDSEAANEGAPFGAGIAAWLKNSPAFNLDKVNAPVRLEANEPASLFYEWEWFAVLSHLGRPVEFLYLPDADHVLVKPSHKIASQQGNVDWFCFWLKGEEDRDPHKADQYSRWRKLRDQRTQQSP